MAHYYLTRRAFLELEDIFNFSVENWGERVAQTYMCDLFNAFGRIADNPIQGEQRQSRSFPYLMAPAGKHYAVYEPFGIDIIIVTVIHSKRDIETLIKKLGSSLANEAKQVRRQIEEIQQSDT